MNTATYTNPGTGKVHAAGRGLRTLCGRARDYMTFAKSGKVDCLQCLAVVKK